MRALSLILIASCTTVPNLPDRPAPTTPFPDWVVFGSGPTTIEGKHVIVGVGSVRGLSNAALARTTANNRARANVARHYEIFTASVMKAYMVAHKEQLEMKASSEEMHVGYVIKTLSATGLGKVEIRDNWVREDGTAYSHASIDLDAFLEAVDALDPQDWTDIQEFYRSNAIAVLESLRAERDTLRARILSGSGDCRAEFQLRNPYGWKKCGRPEPEAVDLTLPCAASGPAEAHSGDVVLTGYAQDGYVDLLWSHPLDLEDDCDWRGEYYIEGAIDQLELVWQMSHPRGQKDCSPYCKADVDLDLTP